MNEETRNLPIEPDLEARIVALVLGEASDFETEELERLFKSRPELAAFKREMEQVSKLAHEAGQNELERPDAQWQLSSERRQVVLNVIHGNVPTTTIHSAIGKSEEAIGKPPRFRRRRWMQVLEAAVVTAILVVLIGLMFFPGAQVRESSRRLARTKFFDSPKSVDSETAPLAEKAENAAQYIGDSSDYKELEPSFSGSSGNSSRQNSAAALSAIQESLQQSVVTSSVDPGVKAPITQPKSDSAFGLTPQLNSSQNSSAPRDVSGIELQNSPHMSDLITESSIPFSPTLPDADYGRRSGIDPVQADKFIAEFQKQPGVPASETLAVPDAGTVLLGGIRKSVEAPSLGLPVLDSIENQTFFAGRELAEVQAEERSIVPQDELKSMIASRSLILPQLSSPNGEGNGKEQQGQGLAENGTVDGIDFQSADSKKADSDFRYRFSIGRDALGSIGDDLAGVDGKRGGMDDVGGMGGGGMGGVVQRGGGGMGGGRGLDNQAPSRLGSKNLDSMPSDGEQDDADFELAQSAPAKTRSLSEGEFIEQLIEAKNESGEEGKSAEAEKTRDVSDGEAFRTLEREPESREKQRGDFAKDGRGEESLKQQSAADSLKRLSERQREFESELTRGGQADQKERGTKLGKQSDGLSQFQEQDMQKLIPSQDLDLRFTQGKLGNEPSKWRLENRTREVPVTKVRKEKRSFVNAKGEVEFAEVEVPYTENVTQNFTVRLPYTETPADLGQAGGLGEGKGQIEEILDLAKKPISKREVPSAGLNETNAATEGFSTFSLHVSDVSFKLAAAALARGEWPEAAKIRIEEFVNAFDYGDPLPCPNEKVACVVEQAIHPFLQQRNVLRVSMRTSAEGRAASTPLRLTLVLDNSGSMERIDRQQAVRRSLSLLAQQLSPSDQVTLISFARQPRLLAENVSGSELGKLVELIGQLPSEGGTNIEAALKLAFEKAASQQTAGVQNRIVLLTDGAVNLGNANPESLSRMVETMRTAGIAFDAAGISADGLNDEVLEALTRKGDGRYYLLDGEESSGGRFAQQIAGALRPSASNVKVQVEFNPKRVGQYKLLGFEKHILEKEDFRNDAVDAAELAAAEAGVALYQFEAKADGEGDVGTVSVRFRDLATGQMVEQRWPIPYEANALRPDQAASSIRLATAAAMLAARLRGDALGETVDLKSLSDLMAGLSEQQQYDPRVQQLKLMIEQARQLSEK